MIAFQPIDTHTFFDAAAKNIQISSERKALLHKIAIKIAEKHHSSKKVNLNFICTHNSRRSQLAQVWSFFAIDYFKLKNIDVFSGGTAVTAFYRNTVKTLQNTGFHFDIEDFSHQNPTYRISFKESKKSILGFSKLFDNTHNKKPYIAITTCNHADENCPFIPDALHRFHLPFVDPKFSDKTATAENIYQKTNKQVAKEMYVIFKEVKKLLQ